MKYYIGKNDIKSPRKLEISESEFLACSQGQRIIVLHLSLLERLRHACENYKEIEEMVSKFHLERAIYSEFNLFIYRMQASEFSRRLLSVVASVRFYLNTLDSAVEKISNDPNKRKESQRIRNKMHSENFGYRFMEEIRNHVSHRDTAVHFWNLGSEWDDRFEMLSYSSSYYFSSEYIMKNEIRFKEKILEEVKAKGGKVDLLAELRVYISCACKINGSINLICEKYLNKAMDSLSNISARWSGGFNNESQYGLYLISESDDKSKECNIPILTDLNDYYKYIKEKMKNSGGMERFAIKL
ncbi:hypothetical protein [Marinivivus vitaminiproducens]|uniref:hypothetical protein n=1 Tax=Marinivivus vitaminiproducens TaxID=3035935 RepID=UPI0027A21352|nr:hypothetical protein P4R82_12510 [Geminicoccaceae bacterium SCSIO 64248]